MQRIWSRWQMKILLTGASGFIGGELLKQLYVDGHSIVALGRKFKTKIFDDHILYFEGELTEQNQDELLQLFGNHFPQVVIHAAGQAHLAQTQENMVLFEQNNVSLTANILSLSERLNVKKFIFFSSVSVLNDDINDVYAISKRTAEEMVKVTCSKQGINYAIVRPVMVYGENDVKGNMAKLIRQIDRGFFPLFNQGENIKDILYVQNLVAIISALLKQPQWGNQVLFLKDSDTLTLNAICREIIDAIGHQCWLIPVPSWTIPVLVSGLKVLQDVGLFHGVNANSIRRLASDVNFGQRIDENLNFQMPYSSHQGLEQTVKWYLANK